MLLTCMRLSSRLPTVLCIFRMDPVYTSFNYRLKNRGFEQLEL